MSYLVVIFMLLIVFFQPFSAAVYMATHVVVHPMVLKTLELGLLVVYGLANKRRFTRESVVALFAVLVMTSGSCLLNVNRPDHSTIYASILTYLAVVCLVFISSWASNSFESRSSQKIERFVASTLVLLSVPLFVIGALQYIRGVPLFWNVVTAVNLSGNTSTAMQVYDFYGRTRAFSLFLTSEFFAFFINLIYLIGLSKVLLRKQMRGLILVGISLIVLYMTLKRSGYLQVGLGTLSVIYMYLSSKHPRLFSVWKYLLGISATSVLGFVYILNVHASAGSGSILGTDSLQIRLANWNVLLNNMSVTNPYFWLGSLAKGNNIQFIHGYAVSFPGSSVIVDNGYLALIIFGGVIFLVLVIALAIRMTQLLFIRAKQVKTPLAYALASLVATWPMINFFSDLFEQYALMIALFVILYGTYKKSTAGPGAHSEVSHLGGDAYE